MPHDTIEREIGHDPAGHDASVFGTGGKPHFFDLHDLTAVPARPSQVHLVHESFYDLLKKALEDEGKSESEWRIEGHDAADARWIMLTAPGASIPEQGWKLHISATVTSAPEVLERAAAVLIAERVSFKVAKSSAVLLRLNTGEADLSQVGKFMTVYPTDDEQAVRVAVALDRATEGLRGPAVPSDHPLRFGSLVHYRYGGLSWRYVSTPRGDLALAINGPGGDLVPDKRQAKYHAPEWVADPFVAAGAAEPLREESPLVGGRYLVNASLSKSARGTVDVVTDIATQRRRILKRAYRDGVMGLDGCDARDRLRQEAYVLSKLASDPRFPAIYELFEEDGDLFLAMEDVQGETLFDHVVNLAKRGKHLPGARVVEWGRALASMLAAIHDKGFVYRDLKTSNVIVTNEGLRLIDFDIAQEGGEEFPFYSAGTPGYTSPEQRSGSPPSSGDDIYGFGAVLYFLATAAEPSNAPRPRNLLARPVHLLNPAASEEVAEVIARCLRAEETERFASMQDVESALASIEHPDRDAPPFGGEQLVEPLEEAQARYLEQAKRAGDTLCQVAHEEPGGGLSWRSSHPSASGTRPMSINIGCAGVVLALAEIVAQLGDEKHRDVLARGARWLARAERPSQPLAGLYRGEAGIGAALLRAGQALGDSALIEAAVESGRRVAALPYVWTDLYRGTAGRLRFHLFLWDETRAEEHLSAALAAGDALLTACEKTADGTAYWPAQHDEAEPDGQRRVGYAHGAAGIADALLDLSQASGDSSFLETALASGAWIASLALPSLDDDSGLEWPSAEGRAPSGSFWSHGSAGIGRFFLYAAQFGVMPGADEIAAKAARSAARGARAASSIQHHGLAGNIELLLDMYRWTGDAAYLSEAMSLARLLEVFSGEMADGTLVWAGERPTIFTPDYMMGYGGIAVCLLRLSDPKRLPHQLSRAGFASKSYELRITSSTRNS